MNSKQNLHNNCKNYFIKVSLFWDHEFKWFPTKKQASDLLTYLVYQLEACFIGEKPLELMSWPELRKHWLYKSYLQQHRNHCCDRQLDIEYIWDILNCTSYKDLSDYLRHMYGMYELDKTKSCLQQFEPEAKVHAKKDKSKKYFT